MPKKSPNTAQTTATEKQPVVAPTPLALLWQVVRNACCVFTLCSVVLILIQWAIAGSIDDAVIAVDAFLLLYPLSLGIAGAHTIRLSAKVPMWAKYICHPLLCLGGVIVAYLPYKIRNAFPASTVMVHLLAFAVVYGVVMAVLYILSLIKRGSKGQKRAEETTYQPVFGKKDNDR